MSANRTVEEKVGDFHKAYVLIRETLTPEAFRALTTLAKKGDDEEPMSVQNINIGVQVARVVFANDRTAALVAAMLTTNGVKPVYFDAGDEPE